MYSVRRREHEHGAREETLFTRPRPNGTTTRVEGKKNFAKIRFVPRQRPRTRTCFRLSTCV